MKEHVIVYYEADDGKEFEEMKKCMEYEMQKSYAASGIRFYTKDWFVINHLSVGEPGRACCNGTTYDLAKYITIDRNLEEENRNFVNKALRYYGWELLRNVLYGTGNKYCMNMNDIEEIC